MITWLIQIVGSIYVSVLNAEIFGRSLNTVAVKVALGLLALMVVYIAYRAFMAWVDRHRNIVIPALIVWAGYVSFIHFID